MNYSLLLLLIGSVLLVACGSEEEATCSLALEADRIAAARCGQPSGSVTLAATGSKGQVRYQLGDSTFQTSASFGSLPPGSYRFTAQDEAGCTATTTVTLPGDEVNLAVTATVAPSPCLESEGRVTLEVAGGTPPYQYRLDTARFVDGPAFTELSPGPYTVSVQDAEGCATQVEVLIPSGISFEAVRNIITTNCAVTGCHAAGGRNPNFELKENILANAERIRERTGEGSMPPSSSGRSLTEAEIAQIACWVHDGAPDN